MRWGSQCQTRYIKCAHFVLEVPFLSRFPHPFSFQFTVGEAAAPNPWATTLIKILQCDKNLLQGSPHPREFLILLSGVSRPGSVHLRGQQRDEGWRVINCPWTQTGCLHLCRSCATHPQNSGNWCSTLLKPHQNTSLWTLFILNSVRLLPRNDRKACNIKINSTFTVAASENSALSCQFKGFMWFLQSNASCFEMHK